MGMKKSQEVNDNILNINDLNVQWTACWSRQERWKGSMVHRQLCQVTSLRMTCHAPIIYTVTNLLMSQMGSQVFETLNIHHCSFFFVFSCNI